MSTTPLLALPCLLSPRGRGAEEHAHRIGRLEARRVNGACGRDELLASSGRLGIEQSAGTIEPAGRRARKHADLIRGPLGRLRRDPLADGALREPPERDELAARQDRRRERSELTGDEDDDRVCRRLLEVLEQRIGGVLVHAIRVEDHVDPPIGLERPHVQVVAERANVVDADHLAERLEQVQVRMRAGLDTARVSQQRRRERERRRPLADARGAMQEVRVRDAVLERGAQESLRLRLLRYGREVLHTPPRRGRRRVASHRGRRSAPGTGQRVRCSRPQRGRGRPLTRARAGHARDRAGCRSR